MKYKKILTLFLFSLLPFLMAKPALAGFGVSPAEIYNDSLKPGAKFEQDIVLSRSEADEDLKVTIETDLGETESWIKFDPGKEFIFPKGQSRKTVKVSVAVPNNAELKNYKGVLRIKAASVDAASSGVSIVKGARMEVNLVTTSINVDLLNIKGLNIPNLDFKKPIKLLVNIQNNGNTEVAPSKIDLEIQDLNQKVVDTQEVTKLEKVAPNTTKEVTAEFENKLNSGEYFGIVKVYLDDKLLRSDRLVFKIGPAPAGYKAPIASNKNILTKITTTIASTLASVANTIKQNKVETIAVVAIPLIPIAVGLSIYKFGFFLFVKKFFLVGTIGYVIVTSLLTSLYHFQWKKDFAQPGDVGNVKGVSTEITKTPEPKNSSGSPFTIKQTAGYPIYRTPDLKSTVVYTATENEKLNVVNEIDGWYQVSTGKGTGGWLPKSSVKKTE